MTICALVGASEFNAEHFQMMDAAGAFDYVIAVDGGFAHLESIGRQPDMAMGDFDSLGYVPSIPGYLVFRRTKTPRTWSLPCAARRPSGIRKSTCTGAWRQARSHAGNLQLFSLFSEKGLAVTAIDRDCAVTFVTGPDAIEMPARDAGRSRSFP